MNKLKPQNESEHVSNTAQIDSTDRQYLDMQQIQISEINAINQQIRISERDEINQRMQASILLPNSDNDSTGNIQGSSSENQVSEPSHDATASEPQSPNRDHQNPAQNSVQNPVQNLDTLPR